MLQFYFQVLEIRDNLILHYGDPAMLGGDADRSVAEREN
jgi:hypothetical protein